MTPQQLEINHQVRNLATKIKIRLRHREREYTDLDLFEEVEKVLDNVIELLKELDEEIGANP